MAKQQLTITTGTAQTIATAPADLRADQDFVVRVINTAGGVVTLTSPFGTDTIDAFDDTEAVAVLDAGQALTAVSAREPAMVVVIAEVVPARSKALRPPVGGSNNVVDRDGQRLVGRTLVAEVATDRDGQVVTDANGTAILTDLKVVAS